MPSSWLQMSLDYYTIINNTLNKRHYTATAIILVTDQNFQKTFERKNIGRNFINLISLTGKGGGNEYENEFLKCIQLGL